MLIHASEMKTEVKIEMRGGKGETALRYVTPADNLNGQGRLFAEITLEPGCSIGYHEHHGESELFYILRGQGTLSDNGAPVAVCAGDCAICRDGEGHAIENTGAEPLSLMALIVYAGKK